MVLACVLLYLLESINIFTLFEVYCIFTTYLLSRYVLLLTISTVPVVLRMRVSCKAAHKKNVTVIKKKSAMTCIFGDFFHFVHTNM